VQEYRFVKPTNLPLLGHKHNPWWVENMFENFQTVPTFFIEQFS
jgi:hypothetical protein